MKVVQFPFDDLSSTGMDKEALDCLLYTCRNSSLGYRSLLWSHVAGLKPFKKMGERYQGKTLHRHSNC
jgi:hypothetical protein